MLLDVLNRPFTPYTSGPLRLVSLVPSTTESLFALGRGDNLVGYTRFCVHPAGQVTADKWIGGTKNPKVEQIIALRPDLVVANREENRLEDIEALEAAGIPVWVAEPRTVEEAIAELRAMGRLVGRAAQGEAIAHRIEEALRECRAMPRAAPHRVAYLIWREPWMVAGQETFISNLLAQGGAINPFPGRYPEVTLDDLREVERVLMASEPFPFAEKYRAELLGRGFAPEQVRLVDGERLSWHGVRLLNGLRYLRDIIN